MSYRQIKWDKQAVNAFHKAIEYIRKDFRKMLIK